MMNDVDTWMFSPDGPPPATYRGLRNEDPFIIVHPTRQTTITLVDVTRRYASICSTYKSALGLLH